MSVQNLGTMRQAWFAPLDDTAEKASFLVRDDAFSRSTAALSRTVRLGGEVTTGPYSTWRQSAWTGGALQRTWNDEAMYAAGTRMDTRSTRGVMRMFPGWKATWKEDPNSDRSATFLMGCPDNRDGQDQDLIIGTSDGHVVRHRFATGGNVAVTVTPMSGAVQCGARIEDHGAGGASNYQLVLGCRGGDVVKYDSSTDTVATLSIPGAGDVFAVASFAGYTFAAQGTDLWKRDNTGAWSSVKEFENCFRIEGMCVHQGRLWFGVHAEGNVTHVYSSDGSTVVWAFDIEGGYTTSLVSHYGSLFMLVRSVGFETDTTAVERSVLYRYNGQSLVVLHDWRDRDTYEVEGGSRTARQLAVLGKYVVMGVGLQGGALSDWSGDLGAYLMYYDVEQDAIVYGPGVTTAYQGGLFGADPISCTALCAVGQTILAGFKSYVDYGAADARKQAVVGMVRRAPTPSHEGWPTTTGSITPVDALVQGVFTPFPLLNLASLRSSLYDGGLPGDNKTWLSATIRFRIPEGYGGGVFVSFYTENGGWREYEVIDEDHAEVAYPNWSTAVVPLLDTDSDAYVQGKTARYAISLGAHSVDSDEDWSPEVDDVVISYVTNPPSRRLWRVRVMLEDAQDRLDGTANPLTTRDAMVSYIEGLASAGSPVAMWGPLATSDTPSDDPKPMQILDFTETAYRIASDSDGVCSEIALTMMELT